MILFFCLWGKHSFAVVHLIIFMCMTPQVTPCYVYSRSQVLANIQVSLNFYFIFSRAPIGLFFVKTLLLNVAHSEQNSLVDRHRFDANPDPDPTFEIDADLDPDSDMYPDPTSSYTQG
jgi:hypothetical protein